MITTPTGKPSAKRANGRIWRRHIRIEKIAQLSKTGMFSNEQIAAHMGIDKQTVVVIKTTKEYQAKMIELTTGVISDLADDIRQLEINKAEELKAMVPSALLSLRQSLLSANEGIRLKAAVEVLDRDGQLAKVSKVNVKHEASVDYAQANAAAFNIMALLGRPVGNEVEAHVVDGFTMKSADATQQVKNMAENIDADMLEKLDIKTPKQ